MEQNKTYEEMATKQSYDDMESFITKLKNAGYSVEYKAGTNEFNDTIFTVDVDGIRSPEFKEYKQGYENALSWMEKSFGREPIKKETERYISKEQEDYINKKVKIPVLAAQAIHLANIVEQHKDTVFLASMTEAQRQAEINELNEILNNPAFTRTEAEVAAMGDVSTVQDYWDVVVRDANLSGNKSLAEFAQDMNNHDKDRLDFMKESYKQDYELMNQEKETLEKIREYQKAQDVTKDFSNPENLKEAQANAIASRPLTYIIESLKESLETIKTSRQMLKENDKEYRTIAEQAVRAAGTSMTGYYTSIETSVQNSISGAAKSINKIGRDLASAFVEFGKNSVGYLKQASATLAKGTQCFMEIVSFGAYSELKAYSLKNEKDPAKLETKYNQIKEIHDICWGEGIESPAGDIVNAIHRSVEHGQAMSDATIQAAVKVKDCVKSEYEGIKADAHDKIDDMKVFASSMKASAIEFGKNTAEKVTEKKDKAIESFTNKMDAISMAVAINKTKLQATSLLFKAACIEKTAEFYDKQKSRIKFKVECLEDYDKTLFKSIQDIEKQKAIIEDSIVPFVRKEYSPSPELLKAKEQLKELVSPAIYKTMCKQIDAEINRAEKEFNKNQDKLEQAYNIELSAKEGKLFNLNADLLSIMEYKQSVENRLEKATQQLESLSGKSETLHKEVSDRRAEAEVMLDEINALE